ncbi:M50 family metallopeptidase [Propionicicella superfundia]|uniref:M50 family metallopeptidase n=1 Tax=Propionicicella superfundia TaxID=348582 RepID=UPI0003F66A1E|nr:M50 family metallopeptidase [Propionicicella superfundia]
MDLAVTIVFGILFFALIMASIALHEVGHMVPAKLFGVRVPKYFVGFGPTLWSTKVGDTEYGLKWFPLGGFVRLLGMYPPRAPKAGERRGRVLRLADDARAWEWQEITQADVDGGRLFYQKRTWQKLIIMAGGPMMNVLLAFLLFLGVNLFYGQSQAQLDVAYVQTCVATDTTTECPADPTAAEASPAYASGIKVGDKIVAFNGREVSSWDELSELIRANGAGEARLTVERDGTRTDLTPVHTTVTAVADEWDPGTTIEAGWFGVSPRQELVKGGPVQTIEQMWTMSVQSFVALVQFPVKVFNVAWDMVTGQPRDIYGPISIVGASATAGQVVSSDLGVGPKVALFASLLGSVNLFVALFNFVPLVPLDGGHIAGAVYEWLKRRGARLFRRTDPGPVDTARMLPVAYVVGGFILICGIVLIVADIISPIKLL